MTARMKSIAELNAWCDAIENWAEQTKQVAEVLIEKAAKLEDEQSAWVEWLADNNYGIDLAWESAPPCTIMELAEEYASRGGIYGDDPEEIVWTLRDANGSGWEGEPVGDPSSPEKG